MSEDQVSAYREGAESGRLVLQRCDRCGTVRHYPRVLCANCYSFDSSPVDGGDTGTVHSWTVTHQAFGPDLPAAPPYVLVTADMPAGVRVLGLLDGERQPSLGATVRLRFERRGPAATVVPVFELEPGSSGPGSADPGSADQGPEA